MKQKWNMIKRGEEMVNTKLLQSKMILEGFTQRKLAKEAKIGLNVLNKKINNNDVMRLTEFAKCYTSRTCKKSLKFFLLNPFQKWNRKESNGK